jgi:homoserine kinase
MTIHVRAPATSANIGPGFDVAAVALDLWNEMEVGEGDGTPVDESHLAIRAFSRFASPEGRSFTFTDRIPRERGLGSSAAVVALGLVAGATAGSIPTGTRARGRASVRGPRRQLPLPSSAASA